MIQSAGPDGNGFRMKRYSCLRTRGQRSRLKANIERELTLVCSANNCYNAVGESFRRLKAFVRKRVSAFAKVKKETASEITTALHNIRYDGRRVRSQVKILSI